MEFSFNQHTEQLVCSWHFSIDLVRADPPLLPFPSPPVKGETLFPMFCSPIHLFTRVFIFLFYKKYFLTLHTNPSSHPPLPPLLPPSLHLIPHPPVRERKASYGEP